MRLAILKKDIQASLPKGVILFWLDDSFIGNEYHVDVAYELPKNFFKNSEELHESLIFVYKNPTYKRTPGKLEKRNSLLIEKLKDFGLTIDWKDNQNGSVSFEIIEKNGFSQKFTMKKTISIYNTIHRFFDIVDAKIEYLESLKMR